MVDYLETVDGLNQPDVQPIVSNAFSDRAKVIEYLCNR
jgi:hypothetical protein